MTIAGGQLNFLLKYIQIIQRKQEHDAVCCATIADWSNTFGPLILTLLVAEPSLILLL